MDIKFLLKQSIDEGIDIERWTGRPANTQPVIDKEAARAFQIKFDSRAAHFKAYAPFAKQCLRRLHHARPIPADQPLDVACQASFLCYLVPE